MVKNRHFRNKYRASLIIAAIGACLLYSTLNTNLVLANQKSDEIKVHAPVSTDNKNVSTTHTEASNSSAQVTNSLPTFPRETGKQCEEEKEKSERSAEFLAYIALALAALSVVATFVGIVIPLYEFTIGRRSRKRLKELEKKIHQGLKHQDSYYLINIHILRILQSYFRFLWHQERGLSVDQNEINDNTPIIPPASAASVQIESVNLQTWLLGLTTRKEDIIEEAMRNLQQYILDEPTKELICRLVLLLKDHEYFSKGLINNDLRNRLDKFITSKVFSAKSI